MSEDVVVGFTPVRAAQRVARWHGKIRSHAILLAIAVVFAVVVLAWLRRLPVTGAALVGLLVAVPLVLLLVDVVFFTVAKRDLASVGEGEALAAGRDGLAVRGTLVPWRGVRRVFTRPGGLLRSSLLVADTEAGELTLPLDYVDHTLADIDQAVRLASGGRVAVAISPLEVVQRA